MQNVQSTALNRVECPYADPFFLLPDGLYIRGFSHGEEEARFISNFLPIIDTVIEYDICFPDACVWGKHSAWLSTAHWAAPASHRPCAHAGQNRAEARTHF